MNGRRDFLATAAAALSLVAAAGGRRDGPLRVRKFATCPRVRLDLPARDYVTANRPRSAGAISFRAVLIKAVPPPADATNVVGVGSPGRPYAYYQLSTSRLGVEQCSISRVALAIWPSGDWILSLRADQNPGAATRVVEILPGASVSSNAPVILPGSTGPSKVTTYIKRNLFSIHVRGLAAYDVPDDPDQTPGHPVLFELAPDPFWVRNGIPVFPRFQGNRQEIATFFQDIDRIEVELSYR